MTDVADRALVRRMPWPDAGAPADALLTREWLVTNGLGGYASGTVGGVMTRRYHGLLVAALPSPLGRIMMLNDLSEQFRLPDGRVYRIASEERLDRDADMASADLLREFRIEWGVPVWRFELGSFVVERTVLMPYFQNTVHVTYRVVEGTGTIRLKLRPSVQFRRHEDPVNTSMARRYQLRAEEQRLELVCDAASLPPLRLRVVGERPAFTIEASQRQELLYRIERSRGYEYSGDVYVPGYFRMDLSDDAPVAFVASLEPWEAVEALDPHAAIGAERERLMRLLGLAGPLAADDVAAELVLAADRFIITPAGRVEDAARAHAAGDDVRTVIAGYHWFTDWGRDTMISLEGLTLVTGRHSEAGYILRTFAQHVRDGLIPNMFPEGDSHGLYHTADATLWFFHAIERYVRATGDGSLVDRLLPALLDIVEHHVRGTRFGIGVDEDDGLLRQGAEGYQLTWMDAKVGDWVVTPRRGKAVEINALWYNALRLLAAWLRERDRQLEADRINALAARARDSFNARFWSDDLGHLFDVVDGEHGDDAACRPNQIFAIALDHPVLRREKWIPVLDVVRERLLTPVGLRSLEPGHADYKRQYYGDLRARDAAYHQGTVWSWLIGPFIDAWLKAHPGEQARARTWLEGSIAHLGEACIGSISEIFDAEDPYTPRGCIAQAWSVAEVLRCWGVTRR
jgi:predicted glycogen debranching enzyme